MSSTNPPYDVEPHPAADAVEQTDAAPCANCGAALHGAYCSACGQRDQPLRQPIGRFLKEAFIEFLGVDGRMWQSLGLLLVRPGRLTTAYLSGQRVRYLRPLRLYLVASLLFFFLLSVIDPVGQIALVDEDVSADTTVRAADYRVTLDSLLTANAERVAAQEALVDSLEVSFTADSIALATASLPDDVAEERTDELDELHEELEDERDDLDDLREHYRMENRRLTWVREEIGDAPADSLVHSADLDRAAELLFEGGHLDRVEIDLPDWFPQSESIRRVRTARTGKEIRAALAAFLRDVLRRLPTVMFLLLPAFALLLKLLYIRRGWYYSEHLVFGLHTHAFAFIMFTVMLLLARAGGEAAWAALMANLIVLLIPIYFYVAQKRVYGQGWIKTALKAWLLGWMYVMVLSIGLVFAAVLAAVL